MNASSKLRSVTAVEKLSPIIELRRFSDQRTRGTTALTTPAPYRVAVFCDSDDTHTAGIGYFAYVRLERRRGSDSRPA